jgi:hypothetical protein
LQVLLVLTLLLLLLAAARVVVVTGLAALQVLLQGFLLLLLRVMRGAELCVSAARSGGAALVTLGVDNGEVLSDGPGSLPVAADSASRA